MGTIRTTAISTPELAESQLEFRIGLTRQRTAAYPLDTLDFIMMDLERPEGRTRHAWWCSGDLSGRVLEFLSVSDGIDGRHDPRLGELFERILRTRRPSGLLGRFAGSSETKYDPPEGDLFAASHRLFNGLIMYYDLLKDQRALDAAVGLGDWLVDKKDEWQKAFGHYECCTIPFWITEPLANLYRLTGEQKYLDFVAMIVPWLKRHEGVHSHGLLTTLRGLQLAAIYSGDTAWNEKPEYFRRLIIDKPFEMPDGCVAELFPVNMRNEGCSIADWLMLNLLSSYISGEREGYDKAENILWNALFFNQMVTGGFSHRDLMPAGYRMGPVAEAWWCCTENGGLALSRYAQHAVTLRGDTVAINLLTPGTFRLPGPDGSEIQVVVRTGWPSVAEATIMVRNLPELMNVDLRIPACVRNPRVDQSRDGSSLELTLAGRIGHYVEDYPDGRVLKYGPVVLAPLACYWDVDAPRAESNVPKGYIPPALPRGLPRPDVGKPDADGLLDLSFEPIPDWTHFDLGPGARVEVAGATVNVPCVFDNGERRELMFSPLCHITSNLSYYQTPILFKA